MKLSKQESDSLQHTSDLMYLATNDVASGDYQSSNHNTISHLTKQVRKANKINDSTMTKIGVYAAASMRNSNGF